jgi:hypothetical protein
MENTGLADSGKRRVISERNPFEFRTFVLISSPSEADLISISFAPVAAMVFPLSSLATTLMQSSATKGWQDEEIWVRLSQTLQDVLQQLNLSEALENLRKF